MPKTKNIDARLLTAEAIKIMETLMNTEKIKDNEIILDFLKEKIPNLKDKLVGLCLPADESSKKE